MRSEKAEYRGRAGPVKGRAAFRCGTAPGRRMAAVRAGPAGEGMEQAGVPAAGTGNRKTAPVFRKKSGAVFMVPNQSPLGREPGKMVSAGEKQIWPPL